MGATTYSRFPTDHACRKCDCRSWRACVSPTTGACWWAEPGLCSGCAGLQPDAVPPKAFKCEEVRACGTRQREVVG